MRYFLTLAYNGTAFHGWQRQPNAISVQQVLEEALSTLLREPIAIVGAGRTDTGVHAKEMMAILRQISLRNRRRISLLAQSLFKGRYSCLSP